MDKALLERFRGKQAKIKLQSGFFLTGYIDEISDDLIIFRTEQKSSLIHISEIRELVPF